MTVKRPNSSSRSAATAEWTEFSIDITSLLNNIHARNRLLIKLLHATGITPKELVELVVKDHNTRKKTLLIRSETTKNGQARRVQLSTQLSKELSLHTLSKAKHTHIFSTRQSPKLTTRRVEQVLKDASEQAGIQAVTPRDLRNNYLATARKTTRDDAQLKRITGLKTITKTRALDEEELSEIITTLATQPAREQALINALLQTSLSLTQLITLTKKDINTLTINNKLAEQLHTLATQPNQHIFSTRQSAQLTTRRAEQLIDRIGKDAEVELTSFRLTTTARGGGT